MKKYKFLGVLSFVFIVSVLLLPTDVVAKDYSCSGVSPISLKKKFGIEVVFNNTNNTYSITTKQGAFNYEITGSGIVGGNNITNGGLVNGVVHTVAVNELHNVTFKFSPYIENFSNNFSGFSDDCKNIVIEVSSTGEPKVISFDNVNKGICDAFMSNNHASFVELSGSKMNYDNFTNLYNIYASHQQQFKELFPYCTQKNVSYNYTASQVVTMIKNVIGYIEASESLKELNSNSDFSSEFNNLVNSVPESNRYNKDNKKGKVTLSCDPFSLEVLADGEGYYTNKNIYSYTNTEKISIGSNNAGSCERTCTEVVTVKYGPPVASKAGQCFQYKVKVESKTECKTKLTNTNLPTPQVSSVCLPYPNCNSVTGYEDQAGPNEDFDSCVNDCDGGDYSQKCINKCYDKIYNNSSINTSISFNYNSKNQVMKLQNSSDVPSSELIQAIYLAKQKDHGGKYVRKQGAITWEEDQKDKMIFKNDTATINGNKYNIPKKLQDKDLDSLGYYYFSTYELTERTIYSILGLQWCNSGKTFCQPGEGYVALPGGFKGTTDCDDNCKWLGCSDGESLEPKINIENYSKVIEDYKNAIQKCKQAEVCTTETAEFEISADNKVKNGDNVKTSYDKAIVYSNGNIVDKSGLITRTVDDNGKTLDLIGIGGYCYTKKEQWLDHMTEWSFPRVWFDNKSSNLVFKEPSNIAAYDFVGNLYCSSPKSADVNKKWDNWKKFYYDYYKLSNKNVPALTEVQKTNITKDINNNITATSKDFGYFKWDFDIKCFYSIVNDPIVPPGDPDNPDDPDDPICTEEECPVVTCKDDDCDEKIHMDNYKYRNVSTSDLFPGEDREAGFNWSSGATNINNSNYEVTPVGLQKAIEDRQNEIYSVDKENEYLDYQFVLDKDTINMIRELNDDKKNYTKFDGENVVKDGIIFYRSSLLRDQLKQKNGDNILPDLGCNNIGVNGCEKFYDDTANNLRLTNSKREGA